MIKQFFKDSAIYTFGNILTKGIAVILVPLYTRVFSPVDYGVLEILAVVTSLINLTIAFEISQAIAIYFSEAKKEPDKIAFASTALWFTVVSYTVFCGIIFAFSEEASELLFDSPSFYELIRIFLISLIFQGIYMLSQNQLKWMLVPRQYTLVSVLYASVTAVGVFVFVVFLDLGLKGVIYAQILAAVAGIVMAVQYIRPYYSFVFNFEKLKRMLSFSLPLVPSSIAVFVSLYIDRIVIRILLGLDAVGLYGVGYRIGSAITLILAGFMAAVTPLIYNRYMENETPREVARIFTYFLVLSMTMISGLAIYSREILVVLTTPAYYQIYTIVPIIAASIMMSQMYIFAPGLIIKKKTSTIALVNIFIAGLNILLNFFFIPIYGIMGAALATFIAAFTGFVIQMKISQRYYFILHRWFRIIMAGFITAIVMYFSVNISVGMEGFWLFSVKAIVLLIVGAILSGILLDTDEWIKLKGYFSGYSILR